MDTMSSGSERPEHASEPNGGHRGKKRAAVGAERQARSEVQRDSEETLAAVTSRLAAALELARRLQFERSGADASRTKGEANHLLQLIVELTLGWEDLNEAQVAVSRQQQVLLDTSRELETERARYRDLFDRAPDAYLVTTTTGEIADANEAAGDLFHLEPRSLVGSLLGVYLLDRKGHPLVLRQLLDLATGENMRQEVFGRIHQRGGSSAEVAVSVAGIHDPRWHTLIGARWLIRDVTEWVAAESEVRRLNQQLEDRVAARTQELHQRGVALAERTREAEAANRAKATFLATMSHEIRTPLNAISGYVELLDMGVHGELSERQRDFLRRIRNASAHLLGLVNDILNFAKLESAEVTYRRDVVAIVPLLASAESLVDAQARRKGVRLRRDAIDQEALIAVADSEKVLQIVLNLLTNAIKFTDTSGEVVIDAGMNGQQGRNEHEMVWIEVRDTGRGIAAEQQQAVFEPFVQIGRASPGLGEGVGLGLAISRDLARGMGGDLTLESALGRGSTFHLILPRARHERAAAHIS